MQFTSRPTVPLAKSLLFRVHPEQWDLADRIRLTYIRAKSIGKAYGLTADDLLTLSTKFWQMHTDPIWCVDGGAGTLLTIQYNLCGGTLAAHARKRPDVAALLERVLAFEISGQYCLTELGHGLDVLHLETSATLLPSGDFELNTPNERAAKFMPPTAPVGMPCVAVVFARLMVHGEDHGVKPFVVDINDGKEMAPGVVCRLLSQRGGATPINHSLTYFNRVRLPASALLGDTAKPADARGAFFAHIARVSVGTIAIGSLGIPALEVAAYIGTRYSLRRTVTDSRGALRPVITFRTQKTPIVAALAQVFAMRALHVECAALFGDAAVDPQVRMAVAAVLKTVMVTHAEVALREVGDRCGAQGLFEVNQMWSVYSNLRGMGIAEGDILGISIRVASELLLGRYSVPCTINPDSLLAKHEAGMFEELRGFLTRVHHRSHEYDRNVLPQSLCLLQAVGHRMAYDAAVAAHVEQCLIDGYVASCVRLDAAWYVEALGLSRAAQREMESQAVDAVFPRIEEFLAQTGIEPYIYAPIVSDERWAEYIGSLPRFGGDVQHGVPNVDEADGCGLERDEWTSASVRRAKL